MSLLLIYADPSTKQTFYDQLTIMPTSEAIFLLTTFANMAGCRSDDEMDFIQVVTGEIFEVVLCTRYSLTAGGKMFRICWSIYLYLSA